MCSQRSKDPGRQPRVLFILKTRPSGPYGSWGYCEGGGHLPSGMSVSVGQMVIALRELGVDAKLVQAENNNFIHQEVEAYKPTHVVIEGFWVVPEKFKVLVALNPKIRWIVRCHSNADFLAHEGNVFGWALDYLERGITVAFNSPDAKRAVDGLVRESDVCRPGATLYLPNYYDFNVQLSLPRELLQKLVIRHSKLKVGGEFHVGCFGAIRPLKNTMHQALAALHVAKRMGVKLRFYVNANRIENKGESLITALRSLFDRMAPHELVEVPWQEHDQFMRLLTDMDIVSQVSLSETFNIVLADSVACGVPVIGANIPWLDPEYQADPSSMPSIEKTMYHTWLKSGNETVQHRQRRTLIQYVRKSAELWERYLFDGCAQEPDLDQDSDSKTDA